MKTKIFAAILLIPAVLLFNGCKKDGNENVSHVAIRMMDAPSPYAFEEVNIDVQEVEAHIAGSNGEGEWIRLDANAGIYNILTLTNGVDTLIGSNIVPAGRLTQVRLILGTRNTVKVNGNVHPLSTPGGSESGLKINVQQDVTAERPLVLFLDFDAAKSIRAQGNGGFSLHPVIRAFTGQGTGAVTGVVSIPGPAIAATLNSNSNTAVSYSTYANQLSGKFMFRGVENGVYTLNVYPADSDVPVVVTNITVTAGATTDAGLVPIDMW